MFEKKNLMLITLKIFNYLIYNFEYNIIFFHTKRFDFVLKNMIINKISVILSFLLFYTVNL